MRPFGRVMHNFFHSYYQLRIFKDKTKNYPEAIIESAEKQLSNLVEELKKDHQIDIYAYLRTPAGQEELHKRLIEEAAMDKASDRCNMCGAYSPSDGGCKKGIMGPEDSFPMTCKEFVDIGFTNRFDRIFKTMDRCHACTHHHYEDDELKCRKNMSIDELECPEETNGKNQG